MEPKTEPSGTLRDEGKMKEEMEPGVSENDLLKRQDLSQL